jgi:RNA polymerase sigma-70 factor (ECF subfamily)
VRDTRSSDEELVAAARAGSADAIEALLEKYQQRIFGFGLRMCGDAEDAKEVLQETLLAAARNVKDFRGGSSLSTWLYTIARSFCIKQRRRAKYAPTEELSLDALGAALPAAGPAPDEIASQREVRRALAGVIEALDPDSREVLVLRDIEGLTAPEVAEIAGTSVDAVKSRLHRARASVRELLEARLGAEQLTRRPDCPDVLTAFSKKLEGDLAPTLCADLERHVDACSACRAACESLKRALATCAHLAARPVPEDIKQSVRKAVREALSATRTQSPPD